MCTCMESRQPEAMLFRRSNWSMSTLMAAKAQGVEVPFILNRFSPALAPLLALIEDCLSVEPRAR